MNPADMNLSDMLDEPSREGWHPKPGSKLIGQIVSDNKRTGTYGDYRLLTVVTEEGSTEDGQPIPPGTEKDLHAFHNVLRDQLEELQPQVGERIGVIYYGMGRKAHRYRTVVDRPSRRITRDAPSNEDGPDEDDGSSHEWGEVEPDVKESGEVEPVDAMGADD